MKTKCFTILMVAFMTGFIAISRVVSAQGWDFTEAEIGTPSGTMHARARCEDKCFSAVYSHSTAPFYTLDTPHSVTIVYDQERYQPHPIIMADVTIHPTSDATWLRYLHMTVTLDSVGVIGESHRGLGFNMVEEGPFRMSAQVDMSTYPTGVYPITITFTSEVTSYTYYLGDQDLTLTRTYHTKLIVVNNTTSSGAVAPGWTVSGLQRLYFPPSTSGGGYLIVENGGPVEYFSDLGSGNASNFTTLTSGSGGYVRTYRDGSKVTFDGSGLMISSQDRYGLTSTVTYVSGSGGKPDEIKEPMRVTMGQNTLYHKFNYSSSGFTVTERNNTASFRTTAYASNSSGITSITDNDGGHTDFGYDYMGVLSSIIDRNGATTSLTAANISSPSNYYGYRIAQRDLPTVQVDNGSGGTTSTSRSEYYRPGILMGYHPDNAGFPWTTSRLLLRDTAFTVITGAMGHKRKYLTDVWGQVLQSIDVNGGVTNIVRDVLQPISITRPGVGTDQFQYNGDLLVASRSPSGTMTYYGYGPFDQLSGISGAGVPSQHFYINSTTGNVDSSSVARPCGQSPAMSRFTYDSYGRILTSTSPGNQIVYTHYDPITGNADSTLAAGKRWVRIKFDIYGRDSIFAAAETPIVTTLYDSLNRSVKVFDGINTNPTLFKYDNLYLRSVRNSKGELADSTDYNNVGWVTYKHDNNNLALATSYRYNKMGGLTSYTNRRGQRVNIAYDSLGRIVSKTGDNTDSVYIDYGISSDSVTSWSTHSNAYASVTAYSDSGATGAIRDSVVTWFFGANRKFKIVHDSPDILGSSSTVSIEAPSGPSFTNRYFATDSSTGALAGIVAGNGALSYTYNANGQRSFTVYTLPYGGSGATRTESYTSSGQKKEVSYTNSTLDATFHRQYSVDSVGRITESNHLYWGNVAQRKLSYDALGRLTGSENKNGCGNAASDSVAGYSYTCSNQLNSETYGYDEVGNRTDNSGTSAVGNRLTQFKGYILEYDLDGNLVHKYNATRSYNLSYRWNADNQLIAIVDSASSNKTLQFDYDPMGQLVRRRTNGTVDRYWLWDGGQIIAEMDGSFNKLSEYVYEGTDRPVMEVSGSAVYHVLDEMGNVIGTHVGTGAIEQEIAYSPWGEPSIQGPGANTLMWKGLHWEQVTNTGGAGLYYMRARWYDPELGRFISEDPMGIDGGMNQYVFGENDPINARDPSGMLTERCEVTYRFIFINGQLDSIIPINRDCWLVLDDSDFANIFRQYLHAAFLATLERKQNIKLPPMCPETVGGIQWPVDGGRVSSTFGDTENRPVGSSNPHKGLDIATYGQALPIYPIASGTVISAWKSPTGGNMVAIDHGLGVTTQYLHMRSAPLVRVGERVNHNTQLGNVGATGTAKGVHLHLDLIINGKKVDPMWCMP